EAQCRRRSAVARPGRTDPGGAHGRPPRRQTGPDPGSPRPGRATGMRTPSFGSGSSSPGPRAAPNGGSSPRSHGGGRSGRSGEAIVESVLEPTNVHRPGTELRVGQKAFVQSLRTADAVDLQLGQRLSGPCQGLGAVRAPTG